MALSDQQAATLQVRLTAVEYGAQGINHYRFASLDGSPLPSYAPGAHIDIDLGGSGLRQYSLVWPSPCSSSYTLAVQVSESGKGGSRALHYDSVVGATYRISTPRNHFPLYAGEEHCHLLAGGIGITPIISMFRQLRQQGRAVTLYYWTASAEHTLFAAELAAAGACVHLFHTRTGSRDVPRLSQIAQAIAPDAQLYCCGPAAMIDEFDKVTASRPESRVHRERFSAAVDALQPGDGFQVRLARSGLELTVNADQTLLQVCEAAGVDVAYSCEEGVCGACEVKVLAGQVNHRDTVLTPQQQARNASMMICCSRGVGNSLVLDL